MLNFTLFYFAVAVIGLLIASGVFGVVGMGKPSQRAMHIAWRLLIASMIGSLILFGFLAITGSLPMPTFWFILAGVPASLATWLSIKAARHKKSTDYRMALQFLTASVVMVLIGLTHLL